ncbi:MAG TPA: hypothetical protein VJ917_10055 [Saprospiraceae bacterium]|nr:hypothetical protein [Saprospiraceae bacterium]
MINLRKVLPATFFFVLIFFIAPHKVDAQRTTDEVDEAFTQKGIGQSLWYGGGFTLGFAGTSNYSNFQIGITPMVGYKITDNLSAGPRVGITYQYIKGDARDLFSGELQTEATGLTEYIAGAFVRYKVFQQFFAQFEGEFRSSEFVLTDGRFLIYDSEIDDLSTVRQNDFQPIIAAGYNSGMGLWGYEIMVLYRLNIPEDDIRSPFDIRFGVTYNF